MLPSAELHTFPADRVFRTQFPDHHQRPAPACSDAVAVTHHGMTRVYDCPQDLHAAVLVACAPELERAEKARARRRMRLLCNRIRARQLRHARRWAASLMICVAAGASAAVLAWSLGV